MQLKLDRPHNCLEINNLNFRSSSKYFISSEFVIVGGIKKFRLFKLISEKLFWPFSLPAKIEETETNSEGKKQLKYMLNEKGNVAVYGVYCIQLLPLLLMNLIF